jgi:hypothetical protein
MTAVCPRVPRRGLLAPGQQVTSVSVTEFEAGKTGRSGRVKLSYNAAAVQSEGGAKPALGAARSDAGANSEGVPGWEKAPQSVVVKMSREDFKGRFLNLVLSLTREARFFKEMAAESPIPIPRCL